MHVNAIRLPLLSYGRKMSSGSDGRVCVGVHGADLSPPSLAGAG